MNISPEFLIEGILPANEVHLLGGSSGAGKSTLVFQTLAAWQEGRPVFGHDSIPVPYAYVSLDRSHASVTRTLQRIGLDGVVTNLVCREDLPKTVANIDKVFDCVLNKYPETQFLVAEGYQTLVGDKGNSYGTVSDLLTRSTVLCTTKKITLLGVVHAAKMKVDENFQHPRETLLGSVAWAAYSDTIITMNLNESSGIISVYILPRNAGSEEHEFRFGINGILEPATKGSPKDTLLIRIASLASGYTLLTADIIEMGEKVGAKKRTAERVISECLANKVLAQPEHGMYTRTTKSPLKIVRASEIVVDESL